MTASVHCQNKKTTLVEQAAHRRFLQDWIVKSILLVVIYSFSMNSLHGQESLSINDKGDVGIGTPKPAGKFQVQTGSYDFLTNQFTVDIGSGGVTGEWRRAFRVVNSSASDGKDGGAFGVSGNGKTPGYAYISIPTADPTGYDSTKILVLNNDGNVGIRTRTPGYPLSFSDDPGDKIALSGQSGNNYGFGIRNKLLTIHTDNADADIAFGYGRSNEDKTLTETVRIKGDGSVLTRDKINILARGDTSSFTKNAWIVNGQWALQDSTKNASTIEMRNSGVIDLYGTYKNGAAWDWRQMAHFDGPKNQVEFPNGDVIVRGKLFVEGQIAYFWDGTEGKKWWGIQHMAGSAISSTKNPVAAPSDLRLKTDVQTIPSALEKIDRLRGVTFHWNEQGLHYLTRDIETTVSAGPTASKEDDQRAQREARDDEYKNLSGTSVGVVAQEVESVLPEAVITDETGYKSVKYYELIPLMIEALKEEGKITREQQQTIARQQNEIERLTTAAQAAQVQVAELNKLKNQLEALVKTVDKMKSTDFRMTSADLSHAEAQPAGSQ